MLGQRPACERKADAFQGNRSREARTAAWPVPCYHNSHWRPEILPFLYPTPTRQAVKEQRWDVWEVKSPQFYIMKGFKNGVIGERPTPGCLHTCIFVRSLLQRPQGPFQRVCVALKAKRNFSSPPSLNYRTKEIVCISFPACFQRACKCLSEWAGVTLCSFI